MVVLEELEQVRTVFVEYTKEAFQMLPSLKKPRILDIGCGSGIPAIEIAKITDGEIVGVDIDQSCINEFERKIKKEGLSFRVKALKLETAEIKFPDETFDVIWSEGVIGEYSFEEELKDWHRLLKRNGHLVIHYQIREVTKSVLRISELGYRLVSTVKLPDGAWWIKFYRPIEKKMGAMLQKYKKNPEALELLKLYRNEIDKVKLNPNIFNSAFYIMEKL